MPGLVQAAATERPQGRITTCPGSLQRVITLAPFLQRRWACSCPEQHVLIAQNYLIFQLLHPQNFASLSTCQLLLLCSALGCWTWQLSTSITWQASGEETHLIHSQLSPSTSMQPTCCPWPDLLTQSLPLADACPSLRLCCLNTMPPWAPESSLLSCSSAWLLQFVHSIFLLNEWMHAWI